MDPRIVFVLSHTQPVGDGAEDLKIIGIYSAEEKAQVALGRVKDKPGFRDHLEGFEIAAHVIDRDGWTEGFFTA